MTKLLHLSFKTVLAKKTSEEIECSWNREESIVYTVFSIFFDDKVHCTNTHIS